uniref:Uncharacterized protein n=1 Tax=Rhizophora mucronata TaxID=61149 RepID=A0A2P2L816_RHIMU
MLCKILFQKPLIKLRFINSDGKIQKILPRQCYVNLLIGCYFEVTLFHDLK